MKAEDVIKALIARLPNLTDKFCDIEAIDTITSTGLVATATVAAGHGRVDNELVTITGALSPITVVSVDRSGAFATVVTATNHDLTFSDREIARGNVQEVTLSGANEAEFNGTFELSSVIDRLTFVINITDSGAITATGTILVTGASSAFAAYNGSFNIVVLDANQFTYPILATIPNDATGAPRLHNGHRITGAVTIERGLDA